MAYHIFETPQAHIRANFINHIYARIPDGLYDDVDAIITEPALHQQATFKTNTTLETSILTGARFAPRSIVRSLRESQIPTYSCDILCGGTPVPAQRGPSLHYVKLQALSFIKRPLTQESINYITQENEEDKLPERSARSAITAKKITEHLLPKISTSLQRKPKIALIYGLCHADLVLYLRDQVINYHQENGFAGLDKKSLRLISNYQFNPQTNLWQTTLTKSDPI